MVSVCLENENKNAGIARKIEIFVNMDVVHNCVIIIAVLKKAHALGFGYN
jgi:hypothetical protein